MTFNRRLHPDIVAKVDELIAAETAAMDELTDAAHEELRRWPVDGRTKRYFECYCGDEVHHTRTLDHAKDCVRLRRIAGG